MGNSIHFQLKDKCSCESVRVFEIENVSTREGLELPTFAFMLNALTIWAIKTRHFANIFKCISLNENYCILIKKITEICCWGTTDIIGSGTGLVLYRWLAITQTNLEQVLWYHIMASLGLSDYHYYITKMWSIGGRHITTLHPFSKEGDNLPD